LALLHYNKRLNLKSSWYAKYSLRQTNQCLLTPGLQSQECFVKLDSNNTGSWSQILLSDSGCPIGSFLTSHS